MNSAVDRFGGVIGFGAELRGSKGAPCEFVDGLNGDADGFVVDRLTGVRLHLVRGAFTRKRSRAYRHRSQHRTGEDKDPPRRSNIGPLLEHVLISSFVKPRRLTGLSTASLKSRGCGNAGWLSNR